MDKNTLQRALREPERFVLEVRETCPSSNSVLRDLARRGAANGHVLVCAQQSAGRGRRGRAWLSSAADSLTFSLLWHFPLDGAPLDGLSLAVGVAVAEALEELGASPIGLKWPNDLLAGHAKLGGILIETLSGPTQHSAIIGIGLNLRLPAALAAQLPQAGALDAVFARVPERHRLLAALLDALAPALERFSAQGFGGFREAWLRRQIHAGQAVQLLAENRAPLEGRLMGVDETGALLLETRHGLERIVSGELSLRPA